MVEYDVAVPDITEVGPEEPLEKVGEVMSIVNNVVIVKGLPSSIANQGSEKALDSDTLLVFEDRKVMGYVRTILYCHGAEADSPTDLRDVWADHRTPIPDPVQLQVSS